jgi:hypothetical protein
MVISRPRAIIRRTSGWNPGPMCHRGLGHRHCRHAHGVVLWPEGARILGNRLPPAGRRPLGRVLRRQRVPPVSRMGAGGALRAGPPAPLAPLCLWHDRAASRSRWPDQRLRGGRGDLAPFSANASSRITSRRRAPSPSRSKLAIWPPIEAGYMAADRSWLYGQCLDARASSPTATSCAGAPIRVRPLTVHGLAKGNPATDLPVLTFVDPGCVGAASRPRHHAAPRPAQTPPPAPAGMAD